MKLSPKEQIAKLMELRSLVLKKDSVEGVELARVLTNILKLRKQLGFAVKNSSVNTTEQLPNELYQKVIDGELKLSLEVLQQMMVESEKDPNHWQLVDAVQVLFDQFPKN